MGTFRYLITALFIAFSFIVQSQIKAFPTALGAGANVRANVTYNLYEVTNLNSSGPGSLWDGITGNNNIIVFRVSGIISMNEAFNDDSNGGSNNIILGQTAPFPGITVVANGLKHRNGTNIIYRYVKFRHWRGRDVLYDPSSADAIEFWDCNDIIVDHCSFAYGGDETVSTRGTTDNFTLQNSIITYGHAGSLMGDSGDYTLSENYSSLFNFWHTLGKRTPNPNGNTRFDIIGNVIYNLLNLSMRTGGDIQLNEIGNYYKNAPQSHMDVNQNPIVYTANNRKEGVLTFNGQDNTVLWRSRDGQRDLIPSDFTNTMFPLMNFDISLPDGDDALLKVQNREMGANAYLDNNGNPVFYIDDLDEEAYLQFDNGEFFDWTDPTGLVTSDPNNRTQTNYRVIPQRQWLLDNEPNFGVIVNEHNQTTHKGVVPNVWITEQGLDPNTWNPLGNDLSATYTNIEMYSFEVDGSIQQINVESVSVAPSNTTVSVQQTTQLTATFTPTDASNKSGNWTSSNANIATVSDNGLVTGVSTGTATISFTSNDGGFTDMSAVTVTPFVPINVTGVEVIPVLSTISIGNTLQLSETVLPNDATDKTGVWSSNNGNATVSSSGLVTGITQGTSTITFTTNDGSFTDTTEITVIENVASDNLVINGTFTNNDFLTYNDNRWDIAGGIATFNSSADNEELIFDLSELITSGEYQLSFDVINPSTGIFSVNLDNIHTIIPQSTYSIAETITVTYNHTEADANNLIFNARNASGAGPFSIDNVSLVRNPSVVPVTGVRIIPSNISVINNNSAQLSVDVFPVNAIDQTGVWSSSNGSVATVDQSGIVTAVSEGTTTIAFTANDTTNGVITNTCVVTVVATSNNNLSKKVKTIIISNN